MPKKPTNPFGTLDFSKDGKVKKNVQKLPDDKVPQEKGVFEIFAKLLKSSGRVLTDIKQLPEGNHDFEAKEGDNRVTIQLVELVDRDFVRKESVYVERLKQTVSTNLLNPAAETGALTKVIEDKLDRKYSKPTESKFWLVIFSTYPYLMEFWKDKQKHYSAGLIKAVEFLNKRPDNPFDEIWFTDLITNPVRIYPR